MKQALFISILSILLVACGKHKIENFGYTKETKAQEGDKSVTWADFIEDAIDQNDKSAFEKLLTQNVDVNIFLKNGRTPLIHAVISGDATYVFQLLKKGANVSIADKTGKLPLEYAIELNKRRVVLLLDPAVQQEMQESLMQVIVADGDDVAVDVDKLLNEGADPNFIYSNGETPLTQAIKVKSNATTKIIKWVDADFNVTATNVNLPNAEGVKPLALAKSLPNSNKGILKKIIDALVANNATE